jgi:Uma2 family endonuclease
MADDLDHVGTEGPYGELDLLKRIELVDGTLVVMSPQTAWHRAVIGLVVRSLVAQAPAGLAATSEMDVKLGPRQRPVPDVLVITAAAAADLTRTFYSPIEVRLVVEVVSEESAVRDRERKPQLYARAGIPFFWRIENADGRPVAYTFELDRATAAYGPTGIFHGRIRTDAPFPVDVDLTTIGRPA